MVGDNTTQETGIEVDPVVEDFYSVLPEGIVSAIHLAQGLQVLIDTQFKVSRHVPGAMPPDGFPADKDAIRTYTLAAVAELIELAGELGWKPWKKGDLPATIDLHNPPSPHDHSAAAAAYWAALRRRERILDECADVLAFLGIIVTYVLRETGAEMHEVASQYARKSSVNMARIAGQVAGYGVEPGAADRVREEQRRRRNGE